MGICASSEADGAEVKQVEPAQNNNDEVEQKVPEKEEVSEDGATQSADEGEEDESDVMSIEVRKMNPRKLENPEEAGDFGLFFFFSVFVFGFFVES